MTGDLNCNPFGTDNAVFGVNWSSVLEPDEQKHGFKLITNYFDYPNFLYRLISTMDFLLLPYECGI